MDRIFFKLDISDKLNEWINEIVFNYGDGLREVSAFLLTYLLVPIETFLLWVNPIIVLAFVAFITWNGFKRINVVIIFVLLMYIIGCFGLWNKAMQTFSIMLVSILIVMIIGIPVGILLSYSKIASKIIAPILDAMQTFPMFVYMLPAVMLFSIGKVPAVMATVIYSLPPLIRLTELGLNQVNKEVKEATRSFGATRLQAMFWVYLPLSRPSIMTGINQTTMMALAMVVVASMIGARGLGEDVLYGITNLDFGRGFTAGVSIVIIAFLVDRISQIYGRSAREKKIQRESGLIEDKI